MNPCLSHIQVPIVKIYAKAQHFLQRRKYYTVTIYVKYFSGIKWDPENPPFSLAFNSQSWRFTQMSPGDPKFVRKMVSFGANAIYSIPLQAAWLIGGEFRCCFPIPKDGGFGSRDGILSTKPHLQKGLGTCGPLTQYIITNFEMK